MAITTSSRDIRAAINHHIRYSLGKENKDLTKKDAFRAVALALREQLVDGMLETEERFSAVDAKRVYYLSMEFLIGRSMGKNLLNLGVLEETRAVLREMGFDLDEMRDTEVDAALGNGGLGRLAACFLDSMATLDIPGYGYGINYEYGLFRQELEDGYQKEKPDNWRAYGDPWEIERADEACVIPIYGRIEHTQDRRGNYNPMWMDWRILVGVPSDIPIAGYGGRTFNFLRLYSARASQDFDMEIFNEGDYLHAVQQKIASETISKVLYPADSFESGRELRLVQEYFLVACSTRDIFRRYLKTHEGFDQFPDKVAIQLNDTHPALTIAEMMRTLVDQHDLPWEKAWDITEATIGYTNHTLMAEALERWPVPLMEHVVPRHLQIVYEINGRFLEQVSSRWPGDIPRLTRMSTIQEGDPKQIRMAHLSIIGSHSVNGVSALHSDLVKKSLVPDFYELWPDKFNNKTNGITPRRWLLEANPGLAQLITDTIGDSWIVDLDKLRALDAYATDPSFQQNFLKVKLGNKTRLADLIRQTAWVKVDPTSLFDVQTKRFHEYKRQLLKVLHIIYEYLCLVEDGRLPTAPRTFIFAGKAAPGYWAAKQIIKLINNVAHVINTDSRAAGHMKVVFLPDYRVTLAERIIPAADLSEQISTAGTEASGTGNMKFALNGALTMGTLDGANIEIREEVGEDNIFIFGLKAPEIANLRQSRSYRPSDYCDRDPVLRRVLDSLDSDRFCVREPGLFRWISAVLLNPEDPYFHLGDMPSYLEAQGRAASDFQNPVLWASRAILNVARIGKFSSDRTIREYAREIWQVKSI